MSLSNDIVLRPRFKVNFNSDNETLLSHFERTKDTQSDFIITRVDDHVFIRLPKHEQHFWSPQLHLEIMDKENGTSTLYGLFGPNPTVWTMFIFMHFVVAAFF
ncbi:MAG: GTP-binding protein, partial [Bacteroidota bacterium]